MTRAAPPIYVNGRFLGRPVTGVERFGGMILREIDALAKIDPLLQWKVLAPKSVECPSFLRHLPFANTGSTGGHLWEQWDLWRASRDGVLINFCNSGPVLQPRQVTVIHDALVYRHPEYFSMTYRALHQTLGRTLARRSRLATVSEFSRSELSEVLRVPAGEIAIVPNAVAAETAPEADISVLNRLSLVGRPFLLFIGSPAPNKNLGRAIEAFLALGRTDIAFVIVGGLARSFAATQFGALPESVIFAGRLSDAENQALFRSTAALVFPSLYEGFGIPPLEAMNAGAPVIASDIPSVREVCRDAVLYFDPLVPATITEAMRKVIDRSADFEALRSRAHDRIKAFSWRQSALAIVELVRHLTEPREAEALATR